MGTSAKDRAGKLALQYWLLCLKAQRDCSQTGGSKMEQKHHIPWHQLVGQNPIPVSAREVSTTLKLL